MFVLRSSLHTKSNFSQHMRSGCLHSRPNSRAMCARLSRMQVRLQVGRCDIFEVRVRRACFGRCVLPTLAGGMCPVKCVRLQLPAQVGRCVTLQEDNAAPLARERRRRHHAKREKHHHLRRGHSTTSTTERESSTTQSSTAPKGKTGDLVLTYPYPYPCPCPWPTVEI